MPNRKINYIACPFDFPIPCFDDVAHDIDTQANYFIAVDMDCDYWKVAA